MAPPQPADAAAAAATAVAAAAAAPVWIRLLLVAPRQAPPLLPTRENLPLLWFVWACSGSSASSRRKQTAGWDRGWGATAAAAAAVVAAAAVAAVVAGGVVKLSSTGSTEGFPIITLGLVAGHEALGFQGASHVRYIVPIDRKWKTTYMHEETGQPCGVAVT